MSFKFLSFTNLQQKCKTLIYSGTLSLSASFVVCLCSVIWSLQCTRTRDIDIGSWLRSQTGLCALLSCYLGTDL